MKQPKKSLKKRGKKKMESNQVTEGVSLKTKEQNLMRTLETFKSEMIRQNNKEFGDKTIVVYGPHGTHREGHLVFNPKFEGFINTDTYEMNIFVSSDNIINLNDPTEITFELKIPGGYQGLKVVELTEEQVASRLEALDKKLDLIHKKVKGSLFLFKEAARPQTEEEKNISEQLANMPTDIPVMPVGDELFNSVPKAPLGYIWEEADLTGEDGVEPPEEEPEEAESGQVNMTIGEIREALGLPVEPPTPTGPNPIPPMAEKTIKTANKAVESLLAKANDILKRSGPHS